jgi:hypothetical protein
MNRDDIIRMAQEAGLTIRGHYDDEGSTPSELVRFFSAAYEAGAAAEREECAKLAESLPMQQEIDVRDQCATAIRARGQE